MDVNIHRGYTSLLMVDFVVCNSLGRGGLGLILENSTGTDVMGTWDPKGSWIAKEKLLLLIMTCWFITKMNMGNIVIAHLWSEHSHSS